MSRMKKISIITVVLNGAKTIEQTILSVIGQGYPDLEYIVIDGGSTDNTMDVVEKYRDRIDVIVSEPDNGLYDAMNKGIRLSSGDIIGIVNSDDWYEDYAMDIVAHAFEHNRNIDVVFGDVNIVAPGKEAYVYSPPEFKTLWRLMPVNHPACFIKRKIYEKYGLYDDSFRIQADCELMMRLWQSKAKFGRIGTVLTNFRTGGISSKISENAVESERLVEMYFNSRLFVESCLDSVLDRNTPLYLWGAGRWGRFLARHFTEEGISICGIFDTDVKKWGDEYYSVSILPPHKAGECDQQIIVAINRDDVDISDYIDSKKIRNCTIVHIKYLFEEYERQLLTLNGDCIRIEA